MLQGKRAIVTGASSGIGWAIGRELARAGVRVVVTARRETRLTQLVEAIRTDGGQAEMVVGDITDSATRQATIDLAVEKYGGLDILVNNAGVGATGLFEHSRPETARRMMEVNFFALVEMTRLGLPHLKRGRRPMVVNISSINGLRGIPHNTEYSAAKFAVHGFSEALRTELAGEGIRVLVVSPGTTETEFFESQIAQTSQPSWPEHAPVSARYVARQTVLAIQSDKHHIVPYSKARILYWLNRISPRVVDAILRRYV